ncbi:MAG TPA: pitrilysin family protein [Ignavibacteriaceae bacterium]|nr:pitrilysin family protein [Ignavibacteriaceae bacterium]
MNDYKKTILPNGIRILTETIPYVKSFSLGFWFNVGSRDETAETNGLTHFIEHMLFKGTRKRSAMKIATEIESCGGYLNAFTSKEHTCYYGRGLADHLEKTFYVISDMIQNSAFKPGDIKKEASVVVDELNDIQDNPEELIFEKFEEIIFAGSNLSHSIIGTEKNILGFSQDDLFNFIKDKYGSNRIVIAASGAVDHDKLINLTKKYLNGNFGLSSIRRRNFNLNNPAKFEFIEKEIQQVQAIVGKPTYGYKDEERAKVSVLVQVLGDGSSSRLFQAVRERNGIAYQINSFLNSFYDISSFGVYLSTNEKMIDKALSLTYKEFKKLREKKISNNELRKAKEALKGNFILSLENTSNRMIRMAQSELYFNRIRSTEEILNKIEKVTAEEVIETANDLLDEDSLFKVIIKSKNSVLKTAA